MSPHCPLFFAEILTPLTCSAWILGQNMLDRKSLKGHLVRMVVIEIIELQKQIARKAAPVDGAIHIFDQRLWLNAKLSSDRTAAGPLAASTVRIT
jgi:hypothetical protein